MKLELKTPVMDFDGKEIGPHSTAGKMLANWLANIPAKNSGLDSLKAIEMAQALHKSGELEADESDLERLKAFIEQDSLGSPIAKAHVIRVINQALR